MPWLTEEERDHLLLVLVQQAQRNVRPFGNDVTTCIVCGAYIGIPIYDPHLATCIYRRGMDRINRQQT